LSAAIRFRDSAVATYDEFTTKISFVSSADKPDGLGGGRLTMTALSCCIEKMKKTTPAPTIKSAAMMPIIFMVPW
jgi:hypothetical protein